VHAIAKALYALRSTSSTDHTINFIENLSGRAFYEALGTGLWRWSVSHHVLLFVVMSCVRQTFPTKSSIAFFISNVINCIDAILPTKIAEEVSRRQYMCKSMTFQFVVCTVGQTRFDCWPHSVGSNSMHANQVALLYY